MNKIKNALGYSALESIGSRVFDFAILWVVLNTLPEADIAKFGLATASIFFFNLVFYAPETALLRNQKVWIGEGKLDKYLSAFVSFASIKLLIHFALVWLIAVFSNEGAWLIYAVIFSAITQQIQLAEIARIYMRMELLQRQVAKFELFNKLALFVLCLFLFKVASLEFYFLIYFVWSFSVSVIWLSQLNKHANLKLLGVKTTAKMIWSASAGFSFWSHVSGVLTYYIYNANILYLSTFKVSPSDIALYTTISKVANLFFVIPMFFQSFVPVILSNSGAECDRRFKKLLLGNAALSFAQFLFFLVLGWWLAPIFGVKDENKAWDFYYLGLIISGGVLALNITRPLSTYLLIKTSPVKVMQLVFIPTAISATIMYAAGSRYFGIVGCAIGSGLAYSLMAIMLITLYINHKRVTATSAGVHS